MNDKPQIALYDKNSREEEAELALKRTRLTPAIAWTLTAAMLAIIFGEPLLQCVLDVRGRRTAGGPSWPQAFEVLRLCPGPHWADRAKTASSQAPLGLRRWWAMLPPVREIESFDDALERNSAIGQLLLPRVQFLMTRFGGVGNEQAYVGRDGWLFYRPEVDALMAQGFLEPGQLRRRARSGDSSSEAVQPDPVMALVQFDRELRERGITLIVMPAPMKPSIQPERLSRRYGPEDGPLYNPSYARFLAEMERNGIAVLDVSGDLAAAKRASGRPQFLETDTHWTPEAMELAAGKLADFIAARKLLPPPREPARYAAGEAVVANRGDIDEMLKIPAERRAFPTQQVTVHPVSRPDGSPWQPERGSDVLVLGDSFFNIYSLKEMNWGANAGFVEQLSLRLGRPLDRITINAGGSYTTRQELAKASQRDRLNGKRLVIYEFAMRDLSVGDWKLLSLPAPTEGGPKTVPVPPTAGGELEVEGRLQQRGTVPKPGTVPYKDCFVGLYLKDVRATKGSLAADELLVYVWGMQNNLWTAAATAKPGQLLRLRLTPWSKVETKYGSFNRAEPADDAALLLDVFYGEELK